MSFSSVLLGAALAACGLAAHAGFGVATLPGLQGDGPVTVFYPAAQADRAVQRGPFTLSGFDRAQLPAVDRAIASFFTLHLLP
jgi:hypothetical protein